MSVSSSLVKRNDIKIRLSQAWSAVNCHSSGHFGAHINQKTSPSGTDGSAGHAATRCGMAVNQTSLLGSSERHSPRRHQPLPINPCSKLHYFPEWSSRKPIQLAKHNQVVPRIRPRQSEGPKERGLLRDTSLLESISKMQYE